MLQLLHLLHLTTASLSLIHSQFCFKSSRNQRLITSTTALKDKNFSLQRHKIEEKSKLGAKKMDIFEKGTPRPDFSPKYSFSGETKENDVNFDQMGFNCKTQNPKKPVTKHFMSPTISATSKVAVPRKKALAEKNESLTSYEYTRFQKSPVLESRTGILLHSGPKGNTSETDDDESRTHASLKTYDPFTNYLSPRPKFLRYKPDRKREILERSEILNSQNSKIVDQEESFSPPPQEDSSQIIVKAEDNLNAGPDADDDLEEEEEEEEEEESEEVEAAKSWSLKGLLKFLLVLNVLGLSTSYISSMNSPRPSQSTHALGGLAEGLWRNESAVQQRVVQTGFLIFNLNDDHEFGRMQIDLGYEEELQESSDDLDEMLEPPYGELEDIFDDDESDEGLNWPDWEIAENQDINYEVKEIEEGSDDQLPLDESAQTDAATEGPQQFASLERSECSRDRIDDTTESAYGKEPDSQINLKMDNDHNADQSGEKSGDEMAGTRLERAEDENFLAAKMENMKSIKDLKYTIATLCFSMFSIVLAYLVYIYSPKAIPAPAQDSQLEVLDRKEELIQAQDKAESIVKPSSLEEATEDVTYIIHRPNVELLGEFEIGELSSSLGSCDRKGRTNATEESTNPISQVESQAQPTNVSSTDSPSYGSFTAEKTLFKKEGGREGNVKVVTTPVRRSSRIRNLSVTSP